MMHELWHATELDSPDRVTCVIADDHPSIELLLASYLEQQGIAVVAQAGDGRRALAAIRDTKPQVALLDIRMPGLSGIEVARQLAREHSPTRVVFYTGYGSRALLFDALDAGAKGFVQKEAALDEVVRAIRVVAGGETYIDAVLAATLAAPAAAAGQPDLTPRERDVLRLLAEGLSNEAIGKTLYIAPDTVRAHLRKAMAKLAANTRTEAVAKALRRSLID